MLSLEKAFDKCLSNRIEFSCMRPEAFAKGRSSSPSSVLRFYEGYFIFPFGLVAECEFPSSKSFGRNQEQVFGMGADGDTGRAVGVGRGREFGQ